MRSYPVASSIRLLDGLKFGLLPALAIGMTVCLVLEFGIRLLDRSNGPVLMIPFCRRTYQPRILCSGKIMMPADLERCSF
jgi:hypothetical protein